jgi:hypothetical protein
MWIQEIILRGKRFHLEYIVFLRIFSWLNNILFRLKKMRDFFKHLTDIVVKHKGIDMFANYTGETLAVQKLKGSENGTFLFRASNTDPTAITISVVAGDTIIHRRLYRTTVLKVHSYGYLSLKNPSPSNEIRFNIPAYTKRAELQPSIKNFTQLITQNSSWMKNSLSKSREEIQKFIHEYLKKVICLISQLNVYHLLAVQPYVILQCPDPIGPPSSLEIYSIIKLMREDEKVITFFFWFPGLKLYNFHSGDQRPF